MGEFVGWMIVVFWGGSMAFVLIVGLIGLVKEGKIKAEENLKEEDQIWREENGYKQED